MEGGENNQLVSLLKDMTSNHEGTVRKATEHLNNGFNDAASIVQLCTLLSNPQKQTELRKSAGTLLQKHLAGEVWNQLPEEYKAKVQSELLSAAKSIRQEDNEVLNITILRDLGIVMDHIRVEQGLTNDWNDFIFQHIEHLCVSDNTNLQILGPYLFRLLAMTSPKMLQNYLAWAFQIFMHVVQIAKVKETLSTLATDQLLDAWAYIIPLYAKRSQLQENLGTTLPFIINMARASATRAEPDSDSPVFDVLSKLAKHTPKQVLPYLPWLMDELYALVNDKSLSEKTRAQAMSTVRSCVTSMRRDMIRLKMMDKLLMTLHSQLAVPPVVDHDEELYTGDPKQPFSVVSEAAQTLLFVAEHSDTLRVAERSLRLMEPELKQQESPLRRLAALIFLALMTKGFTDLLSVTSMERFMSAVDLGIHDTDVMVQGSAYFALATMAENLQPELARLADRVLPFFLNFFDTLKENQCRVAEDNEYYSRMFCSLEIYCENLKPEVLQPHLDELMQRLLKLAQPTYNSLPLRQLSLSAIACLAKVSKDMLAPHFDKVMVVTLPLIKRTADEDEVLLVTTAIQVANSMSPVNAEKMVKDAPVLMDRCMDIMKNMEGAQVFTYELFGVLSGLIPKQMVPHFSLIMNNLLTSVKEAAEDKEEDTTSEDSDENEDEVNEDNESENNNDDEESEDEYTSLDIDNDTRDGHGDQTSVGDETSVSSSVVNDFLTGHDEALLCLKAFAINMSDSLLPYLSETVERVLASTDQMQEMDKWSAYDTLTQFILLYHRQGNTLEAKKYSSKILPAMIYFIQTAKETVNVLNVIKSIQQLLQNLGGQALASSGYSDMVFEMLRRALRRKLNCQFNNGVNKEMEGLQEYSQAMQVEIQVMEAAHELVPIFGASMGHREFAGYFKTIIKSFAKTIRTCPNPNGNVSRNSFMTYSMTGRSAQHLGVFAEEYYDVIIYIIFHCVLDQKRHVRDFAIEMLEWALNHSSEQNNAEVIINTSTSIFTEALGCNSPLDKDQRDVISGIMARMIRSDIKSKKMVTMVPYFIDLTLPLNEKFENYKEVVPALQTIYKNRPELIQTYLRDTVKHILGAVVLKQMPDEETRNLALELVQTLKTDHEAIYNEVRSKYFEVKDL